MVPCLHRFKNCVCIFFCPNNVTNVKLTLMCHVGRILERHQVSWAVVVAAEVTSMQQQHQRTTRWTTQHLRTLSTMVRIPPLSQYYHTHHISSTPVTTPACTLLINRMCQSMRFNPWTLAMQKYLQQKLKVLCASMTYLPVCFPCDMRHKSRLCCHSNHCKHRFIFICLRFPQRNF